MSLNISGHAKEGAVKKHKEFQNEVQKRMREIPNQWCLRKTEDAQLTADSKNSKLFYQTLKEMYGLQQSIFATLKPKDGYTTLTQPEDIRARQCEYYTELLNCHPLVDVAVLDLIEQREPIVSLDEVTTRNEINFSVKQMNNNKALEMDSITTEILKCGGDKMIDLLEQVIHDEWESEAPQD